MQIDDQKSKTINNEINVITNTNSEVGKYYYYLLFCLFNIIGSSRSREWSYAKKIDINREDR